MQRALAPTGSRVRGNFHARTAMAPLDVCRLARPQGFMLPGWRGGWTPSLSSGQGGAPTGDPPCTHSFRFSACTSHSRFFGGKGRPQRSAPGIIFRCNFCRGSLQGEGARGSGGREAGKRLATLGSPSARAPSGSAASRGALSSLQAPAPWAASPCAPHPAHRTPHQVRGKFHAPAR